MSEDRSANDMEWFELENLEAIRIALTLVGMMGAVDMALGHLSGAALALPCAIGAVGITAYRASKRR